jgi:methionyl aminopeptidase
MLHYDEEVLKKFHLSGRILRETRKEMRCYVHENMPIIDVCEKAENLIRSKGGKPAFPCNVSANEITAHYTSPPGDKKTIPEGSVVKVDIGVHVDGYVTDTAFTACFNPEHKRMTETAEIALKTAIENLHGEMPVSRIGGLIETTIRNRGFKPISNLTGHSVGRYLIHAGTSIPNISQISLTKVHAGDIFAIEPFVTLPDAAGRVEDAPEETIFRFIKPKSLQTAQARQMSKFIEDNFKTLPFAERWLKGAVPEEKHAEAFKELLKSKTLMAYPVFIEASGKPVTQAEHTVIITDDGCEVLT